MYSTVHLLFMLCFLATQYYTYMYGLDVAVSWFTLLVSVWRIRRVDWYFVGGGGADSANHVCFPALNWQEHDKVTGFEL